MILQIAFDDAGSWKEGDHPRDETGKFTKGGAVTASLAKAGWQKIGPSVGSSTKTSAYKGPTPGNYIEVHNETGAWSGNVNGLYQLGSGKADLPAHLQKGGDGTGGSLISAPAPSAHTLTSKQQDYLVSSHVGKVIKDAGFKKAKSGGELTFLHPSGAKVVIHPPAPDKKFSSEWTHFKSDGDEKGQKGVGVALAKALGQAVEKAEATKKAQAHGPMSLAEAGYAPHEVEGPWHTFKKVDADGDLFAQFNAETGYWSVDKEGGGLESGQGGLEGLKAKLGELYGKPVAPAVAQPSTATHADLEKHKNEHKPGTVDVKAFMAEKGYVVASKPAYGTTVFLKPNGAKVEVNPTTGEWLAETPGHMKKEGAGADNLAKLLSGKPAVVKAGEPPPWKNSSKPSLDPDAAAAAAKAQAEAAAKQAEQQKLANAATETQNKLMAAAPNPTTNEAKAATKYTGSAYAAWNDKLRHDPDFVDESTKQLDSYLDKSSFPEDVTIYRKVSGEYSKILKSIITEGTKFVDHGYVSTSTHIGTWGGDMQWIISVKKGQKGCSVKKLSHYSGENEVLLPRGSAFVVKKYDRKAGVVHVELDQSHMKAKEHV